MTHRSLASCCVAELIGTFLLVFLGCGAVHVSVLLDDLSGLWQIGIVWAIAIMLAVYVVGPISGAHINPAITFGFAVWRMFPWSRVGPYIASQVAGAFVAAAVLHVLFFSALAEKERQRGVTRGEKESVITAMCYGEYFPSPGGLAGGEGTLLGSEVDLNWRRISELTACGAEIIGTLVLAFVVAGTTEPRNKVIPPGLAPVIIGLTVAALICVIAPLTQACFNPARDFGPRLFAALAGWGTVAIPGPRPTGFLTVYILSPLAGGALGVGLYRLVVRPGVLVAGEEAEAMEVK